jgi:hypothetical protein
VKRSHLVGLRDILEAIDAVAEMVTDVRLDDYRGDYKLRRATERCIEIISEASRKIPEDWKFDFPINRGRRSLLWATCCGTNMVELTISSCGRSRLARYRTCVPR